MTFASSADKREVKSSLIDQHPSNGFVYNSMKWRTAFLSRVKVAKEEHKLWEVQQKKMGVKNLLFGLNSQDDPISTPLIIVMKTFHNHFRDNDYFTKQALNYLISDQDRLSTFLNKGLIQQFK